MPRSISKGAFVDDHLAEESGADESDEGSKAH